MAATTPRCPYCRDSSVLVGGTVIYPGRANLSMKWFYLCNPCGAYVGCHPGTTKPLGRLADAELRRAKMKAHASFDPIWRDGPKSRRRAYKWLAQRLNLTEQECHIGLFDVATCRRVVEICRP